ncbi:Na(+) H(+) antiporter subunit D [hydrothermal vent metagenome]|uniref:Na(+) H(+) antiporter subunit D n=1 Tax=hydrothermal vent metagenome TaxID=652676 RepID=A0A1W1CDU5_9ZZZZ
MSTLYFVLIPLLASFLTPFFKDYLKYISVAINLTLLILALSFIDKLPITEYISFDSPLSISFVLTDASLFFIILFTSIMLLFSLYNLQDKSRKDMFILTNMLLASVSGLVLGGDIFNVYIFFEIASITAYILTSLHRDKKAYSGAIRYMIIGSIASIFLLIAIMSIYLNIGSLNLVTISNQFASIDKNIQFLIILSLFIGFGIKAEIFPLNFWVVDIYQASGNRVNALFSSILSKAYIFVFFHIAYLLHVDSKFLGFLAVIGIISFAISELSALSSTNMKRVFAYSTLGQIGILFIALSYGNVAVISGAIFLIALHSITKLMLFLSLDILEQKFGHTKTELFKQFSSPFLIIIFAIGFLSLLGLPPFGGFIAKLTILTGLASLQAYLMIGGILVISLVEAVYFFRLLGMSRAEGERSTIEIKLLPKILLALMAISIIYLGLFPDGLLSVCESVATTLIGGANV